MNIGHFGIALALKKYDQSLSLGFLFFAVQLVDISFFIFTFLGIEHARIIPGFTEASYLDLYDFSLTHSLLGTLFWSILTYLIFRYGFLRSSSKTESEKFHSSILMGIGVFSHYILDFIVHNPDLLIIPGLNIKIGLGIWNSLLITLVVELIFLLGGFLIYFKATSPEIGAVGKYGMPLFMVILIITIFTFTTSNPLPGLDVLSTFFLAGFSHLAKMHMQ